MQYFKLTLFSLVIFSDNRNNASLRYLENIQWQFKSIGDHMIKS